MYFIYCISAQTPLQTKIQRFLRSASIYRCMRADVFLTEYLLSIPSSFLLSRYLFQRTSYCMFVYTCDTAPQIYLLSMKHSTPVDLKGGCKMFLLF